MNTKSRAQILGENLKRIRTDKKISRKQLAELLNVSEVLIGGYETGKYLIPLDKIFVLAEYLKISIVDLTGDTEYSPAHNWQWARLMAKVAGYSPVLRDDGGVTIEVPAKRAFEGTGNVIFTQWSAEYTFPTTEYFSQTVEMAEIKAAKARITFDTAFRQLLDETK